MAIRSIIKMGNAQLASPSLPVTCFGTEVLNSLLTDMKDTMKEKGGVGIAAPQIGINLRVILFELQHNPRYPNEKPIPFTVLINPKIEILSKNMIDGFEGCLSVPGLRGLVPRYEKIKYTGYDAEGNTFSRTVDGFHARVVQHECDHLDGILFPMRMNNMKSFGFEDELKSNK